MKKVAYIMILSPTSLIGHHHKITNLTLSPTVLSPPERYENIPMLRAFFKIVPMCDQVGPVQSVGFYFNDYAVK